jgi:hypothetical protein
MPFAVDFTSSMAELSGNEPSVLTATWEWASIPIPSKKRIIIFFMGINFKPA